VYTGVLLDSGATPGGAGALRTATPAQYAALAALDTSTGAVKWSTAMTPGCPVVDGSGAVYAGAFEGLFAVNGTTGEALWASETFSFAGVVIGLSSSLVGVDTMGNVFGMAVPSPSASPSGTPTPSPTVAAPSPSPSPSPSSLPPVHVGAVGCTTEPGCGTTQVHPCCSLSYAINAIANAVQPLASCAVVLVAGGRYGPSSCGGIATRPLRIVGVGSSNVTVDCAGSGRLLLTNDSVAVVGMCIMRGNASVSYVDSAGDDDDPSFTLTDDYTLGSAPVVGGGGGIAVEWAPDAAFKAASFLDVVWLANTATVSVTGQGDGAVTFGGGGLSVTGGGTGCEVSIQGCAAGKRACPHCLFFLVAT
jgi:hypothetical protein